MIGACESRPSAVSPTAAPAFATARLVLRRPDPSDAPALAAGLSDYAVASMLTGVPAPCLLADAEDWIAGISAASDAASGAFVVVHGSLAIGVVTVDQRRGAPHLGYWLARPFWGRGLMGEAVSGVLGRLFENAPDAAIRSAVFTDDRTSLALQNRLGFAITGLSEAFSLARNRSHSLIETMVDASRFLPVGEREGAAPAPLR